MEKKGTFYITTPIYYPSGNMHIGHTYHHRGRRHDDALQKAARLRRLPSLTGTDEHGQKIERKAAQAGKTPKEFVDEIVAATKDLWKLMNIEYDDFIRTTDERHVKAVQKIFKQFYEQGDIYKSSYEGPILRRMRVLLDAHAAQGGQPLARTAAAPPRRRARRATSSA